MESIQNQQLKGIKPKIEIEWNQTVTKNSNVSNRKPKYKGIKPNPSVEKGVQPKPTIERYQNESNRNLKGINPTTRKRMESIGNQLLKGIKLKTGIEWNQTETKS
jgi:hypothetical protein